ncbi:MAG: hypothetical protein Q7V01_06535 [Vicinamibacterales bacterium]|nr:hypothetical protein [Vicinamibacterales bacterium]
MSRISSTSTSTSISRFPDLRVSDLRVSDRQVSGLRDRVSGVLDPHPDLVAVGDADVL